MQEGRDNSIHIEFDNSYEKELDGFYYHQKAEPAPSPSLIKFNHSLAQSLNIDIQSADDEQLAQVFSGNQSIAGSNPIAQVYAGHQFGHYNPQLGDGRAVLLGEVLDEHQQRKDIQLKGSGKTPFSRSGDGKAALGPVLREYLVSEAMHSLNIPTTRALAAVTTGEQIWRNKPAIGAIVTRVAASHIRVGTFQYIAANEELDKLKQLADYTINRHYPEAKTSDNPYLQLLKSICQRQAELVSKWQLVGFIHGVMNTDNTTISGETIDYGPCAFMDHYDPNTLFSSIDAEGRYAYRNQPHIAQWNLARLAETLLPLISDNEEESVELATNTLHEFLALYQGLWLDGMRTKLGITNQEDGDYELIQDLLSILKEQKVDFTNLFRSLGYVVTGDSSNTTSLFSVVEHWDEWKVKWLARLERNEMTSSERVTLMNAHNPAYIPRNHKVEEALSAAEQDGNYQPFERLLSVLMNPFEEQDNCEEYAQPAPSDFGPYRTFCGT
ncbi:YdiU family protein [Vibrio sp. ZSDE26]|uniref:Protein nucleotidyltransferase YdiU n=1 Tax=Vibrio amylolyticus TaxID=2847292 RepID=A0A9X1XJX0_9VIBR|nr:YdiU family protein [Vibrio amylolyticus]MCK6264239.1 YdiU family protein [Vibrio amylolyticus]